MIFVVGIARICTMTDVQRNAKRLICISAVIGALIGIAFVFTADQVDRYTSTDQFCGSTCHVMDNFVSTAPVYISSDHRSTSLGIQAGCSDCHIPPGLIAGTYTHVSSGIRDILSVLSNDFSTQEKWDARRQERAFLVRDWLLENDSVTCRSCHERDALRPARERGQRQHELAENAKVTCIGCHFNLVHEPVEPRRTFLERVEVSAAQ
jgi:cytochrome c-type protein NapC